MYTCKYMQIYIQHSEAKIEEEAYMISKQRQNYVNNAFMVTDITNLYGSQCGVFTARGTILRKGKKGRIEERGCVNGIEVSETAS